MIKSYLPVLKLSTSDLKILILFSIWCNFALIFAIFIAFSQESIPIAEQFFLSFKTEVITHPDPIPISKINFFWFLLTIFNASSTKNSDSGLGISTFLFT